MSEENNVNNEANEGGQTADIKGTDFVEPKSKVRKAVKWLLGGVALLVSGLVGGLIGHHIGSGNDDGDDTTSSGEEPTNE